MHSSSFTYHSETEVLAAAANIIEEKLRRQSEPYNHCRPVKQFVMSKLSLREQEVFAVLFLDSQNRLIAFKEMFYGTIDAAAVYPREVAKEALKHNAASVILAHNHPSGVTLPSQSDKRITQSIKNALELFDVRTLDHVIAGADAYSLAENGDM